MSSHKDILARLVMLERKFGPPRSPVDISVFEPLFRRHEYTRIVGMVKDQMRLDMGLKVGYVKKGGKANNPAWIALPQPMPIYGTTAFRRLMIIMYVQRSLIDKHSCESFVLAIAHELSHVVLAATGLQLPHDEKLVDLTAMHLGYHRIFLEGSKMPSRERTMISERVVRRKWIFWKEVVYVIRPGPAVSLGRLGYLTEAEVAFAHAHLEKR